MKHLLIALGISWLGLVFCFHMLFKLLNRIDNDPDFKSGDCIAYKLLENEDPSIADDFKFKITSVGVKYYYTVWIAPKYMKDKKTKSYIDVADYGMKKVDCPNE